MRRDAPTCSQLGIRCHEPVKPFVFQRTPRILELALTLSHSQMALCCLPMKSSPIQGQHGLTMIWVLYSGLHFFVELSRMDFNFSKQNQLVFLLNSGKHLEIHFPTYIPK